MAIGGFVYAFVAFGVVEPLFVETVPARKWLLGWGAAGAFGAACAYGGTFL